MSIKLGNTDINKIYLGPTEINKAYLGSALIYDKTAVSNGLLNNLVSYYKMDTSGSFPDAHGSNDGTINGATYTASGKINGGYSFDGVNDYVEGNISLNTSNSFTVGFWCNIDNISSTGQPFSINNGNTSSPYGLNGIQVLSSKKIRFFGFNGTSYVNLETNNSYSGLVSIMIIYSTSNNYSIYINGVLDISGNMTLNKFTSVNYIIGSGRISVNLNKTEFYEGMIDEVGVWDTELSETKRNNWYNSGAGLSYDNFTT